MNALGYGGGGGKRLEAQLYSLFNFGARWGWVVNATPSDLPQVQLYILHTQIRQITTD